MFEAGASEAEASLNALLEDETSKLRILDCFGMRDPNIALSAWP
jgi:hypothetical protein